MTLIPSSTITELRVVSMKHLQRAWHASRKLILLWTPPFWVTCICSNINCRDLFPESTPMLLPLYRTWLSPNYELFQWSICDGFGMPAGSAYPSRHLVQPLMGLAYAPIVETSFSRTCPVVSFLDFSTWISLAIIAFELIPVSPGKFPRVTWHLPSYSVKNVISKYKCYIWVTWKITYHSHVYAQLKLSHM